MTNSRVLLGLTTLIALPFSPSMAQEVGEPLRACPAPQEQPHHILIHLDFPDEVATYRSPIFRNNFPGKLYLKNRGELPDILAVDHPNLVVCWQVKDAAGQVVASSPLPPWGLHRDEFTGVVKPRQTISRDLVIDIHRRDLRVGSTYTLEVNFWGYQVTRRFRVVDEIAA